MVDEPFDSGRASIQPAVREDLRQSDGDRRKTCRWAKSTGRSPVRSFRKVVYVLISWAFFLPWMVYKIFTGSLGVAPPAITSTGDSTRPFGVGDHTFVSELVWVYIIQLMNAMF